MSVPPRLLPFFGDEGRTVIVAMDHPLAAGQVEGLARPHEALARVAAGRPDGMILPRGSGALAAEAAPGVPWFLTADYYATSTLPASKGDDEVHALLWDEADAQAAGASGLKALLVFGRRDPDAFAAHLAALARLIARAHALDLPVMVETVLWGGRVAAGEDDAPEAVVNAARTGFELGADVLKIAVPRDVGVLRELASGVNVPIVLMGGPAGDPAATLRRLGAALDAGAAGVALGRNVWQHPRPDAYVRALTLLVRERRGVDAALDALNEASV